MTTPSGGAPHVTVHRLRFNDTDALGHVNNAVFAVMLEQGRSELVRDSGLGVHSRNHMVVIVRLEMDFVAEMIWPGEIRIETEVAKLGTRSIQLRQRLSQDEKLCARALSVIVVVDRATKRAITLTDAHRASIAAWLAHET